MKFHYPSNSDQGQLEGYEQELIEKIIRWFRTPRRNEVKDLLSFLDKKIKPSFEELTAFEEHAKQNLYEPPKSLYKAIEKFISTIRPREEKKEEGHQACSLKTCDGHGYLYAKLKKTRYEFIFKCKCNIFDKNTLDWDSKMIRDYEITHGAFSGEDSIIDKDLLSTLNIEMPF